MRTSRSLALAAAVVTAAALAACSSSATTAKAGTETFTSGKVISAKILESDSPTLALTYTGVVSAGRHVQPGRVRAGEGPAEDVRHEQGQPRAPGGERHELG